MVRGEPAGEVGPTQGSYLLPPLFAVPAGVGPGEYVGQALFS